MAQADNYNPNLSLTLYYDTLARILMSQYDPTKIFRMRAKMNGNFIYWSVSGTPDFLGNSSGYATDTLSDIVILHSGP